MFAPKTGVPGKSSVSDSVPANSPSVRVVGEIVIKDCITYLTQAAWDADASRHLVPANNAAYSWSTEKVFYGWVVGPKPVKYDVPKPLEETIVRVKRSVFRAAN